MRNTTISKIAVCALALAACVHDNGQAPASHTEQSWGTAKRVVSVAPFYLAGQPDAAGFAQARASGVNLVIDLRDPGERNWDAGAVAKSAGLAYHNVVVPKGEDQPFRPERIQQIEQILAANPESKVLVHCASGSRAAGWYAIHLATAKGLSPEDAIAAAADTGMLGASSEAAARAYLKASRAQR